MARRFERVVIAPDRGDGRPFIQVEWKDEFERLHTQEVADKVGAADLLKVRDIAKKSAAIAEIA